MNMMLYKRVLTIVACVLALGTIFAPYISGFNGAGPHTGRIIDLDGRLVIEIDNGHGFVRFVEEYQTKSGEVVRIPIAYVNGSPVIPIIYHEGLLPYIPLLNGCEIPAFHTYIPVESVPGEDFSVWGMKAIVESSLAPNSRAVSFTVEIPYTATGEHYFITVLEAEEGFMIPLVSRHTVTTPSGKNPVETTGSMLEDLENYYLVSVEWDRGLGSGEIDL